jgi:hypothetical protein
LFVCRLWLTNEMGISYQIALTNYRESNRQEIAGILESRQVWIRGIKFIKSIINPIPEMPLSCPLEWTYSTLLSKIAFITYPGSLHVNREGE